MTDEPELELTNAQLLQICKYAEEMQQEDMPHDAKKMGFVLQAVALCLHRLQAGDPPISGPEADEWNDKIIGQNVRVMWMKVKPVAAKLREMGIID